jgi:hypothetical protein
VGEPAGPSRCAAVSRALAEDPCGSASRARRWVLLEQPGPWGADALRSSGLPTEVGHHLDVLARDLPARVLLLRRPAGAVAADGSRTLLVGRSSPGGGWFEQHLLADPREVLDLDLRPLAEGRTTGGRRLDEPRYLVCTNGRHDVCCAEHGLPVARALAALVGDRAWECSHVGGDRFAANLVCLPQGLLYGHLDATRAVEVVGAHERGRVDLTFLRGRSALPFVTQAAEGLARRALGLDGIDALVARSTRRDGDLATVVLTQAGGTDLEAVVRVGRHPAIAVRTCGGEPTHRPTFELVSLRELAP